MLISYHNRAWSIVTLFALSFDCAPRGLRNADERPLAAPPQGGCYWDTGVGEGFLDFYALYICRF